MKICWGWLCCSFLLFFSWSPMISKPFKAREQVIKFKSLYIFLSQCIMSRVNDWVPLGISWKEGLQFNILVPFSSVQSLSRVGLCDPMDCSTLGFPVHHQLLELTNSCPLSRWCRPTISSSVVPFSSCLQSFPASGSLQMSRFFTSSSQSIGVSASTSVFPMNIQDWVPLGWTG